MLNLSQDTQTLSDFREDPEMIVKHVQDTRKAVTLTINGKAAAVLQNPDEYQRLLNLAALANDEEAIRQGMDDIEHGRTYPLDEAVDAIRRKHAISH